MSTPAVRLTLIESAIKSFVYFDRPKISELLLEISSATASSAGCVTSRATFRRGLPNEHAGRAAYLDRGAIKSFVYFDRPKISELLVCFFTSMAMVRFGAMATS